MGAYTGKIQQAFAGVGPWYMRNKNMQKFLQSFYMVLDESITALQDGVRLGWPLDCDVSALPVISRERGIRLYPTEPEASRRIRLANWLSLHRTKGTNIGQLKHSQPYFLPDVPVMRIVHQPADESCAVWHTLSATGEYSVYQKTPTNWNYDGQITKWWRIWVICYCPSRLLETHHYGDGTKYGSTARYASALSTAVARDFLAMINEWDRAGMFLQSYIIATDPASFDPAGDVLTMPDGWTTLPSGGNWSSPLSAAGIRTRPPTARWLYDRGGV
jgi:hypothetical protein